MPQEPITDSIVEVVRTHLTLFVRQGDQGLWYVTCPQVLGLLVAESTMEAALAAVPRAVAALDEARASQAAE